MKFNFKDINECTKYDSNRICGQNGKCINHYGSYSCECLTGFVPIYNDDGLNVKTLTNVRVNVWTRVISNWVYALI